MSVYRISSNTTPDNGVFHLNNREYSMDKVNNQINTGKKHRLPRENPVDVTQAMIFHSQNRKIEQFQRNITDAQAERSQVEIKVMDTIEVLQRARELSVQMANGTYAAEDRQKAAVEIDQILRHILVNSNSKHDDNFIFSGFKKYTQPFEALEGSVRGINDSMITEVKYLGDNGKHLREIDSNEYVATSKPGSEVFWAEQFQVYSNTNTADFRLTEDMTIMIDGHEVNFTAGDNAYAVVDKINQSPAAVNASLDIVTGGLILKSTVPHKLELMDIKGGTLLQDLGILEEGRPTGPDNFSQNANVFGGSIFDVLIGLRDAMLQNSQEDIGGRYLGALDVAMDNLTHHTAQSGALDNRLQYMANRHDNDQLAYTEAISNLEDVNFAEAITELKSLDFAHKAALSSLAKLSKTSLMDFLR